jgi:hypothetical protein
MIRYLFNGELFIFAFDESWLPTRGNMPANFRNLPSSSNTTFWLMFTGNEKKSHGSQLKHYDLSAFIDLEQICKRINLIFTVFFNFQ